MALEGITLGASSGTGTAPTTSTPARTALAGISLGAQPAQAAPAVKAPAASAPTDTKSLLNLTKAPDPTSLFQGFLGTNGMSSQRQSTPAVLDPSEGVTKNPVVKAITGGSTIGNFITDTFSSLPQASKDVSKTINDTVIQKPADLLANTGYMSTVGRGLSEDDGSDVGANFAQELLHKLSYGTETASGVTGGLYQTPGTLAEGAANDIAKKSQAAIDPKVKAQIDKDTQSIQALKAEIDSTKPTNQKELDTLNAKIKQYNDGVASLSKNIDSYNSSVSKAQEDYKTASDLQGDTVDKGLKILSTGLGAVVGISSLSSVAGSLPGVSGAVEGLTGLVNKFPLVAKYIAPYLKPLGESTVGFAIYGQLDPNLGSNLKARAIKLGTDIATAPLFTALGAIRSAGISIPVSFGLGYGMAKLSGASNKDALASGATMAFLDAAGRANGSRGLTPDDIEAKLNTEALKTLNKYSEVKLTVDSSAAELKAAYYKAVHQVHPDVGGTQEDFEAVTSAYDLLSKGAVSKAPKNTTEAEQSVKLLKGEITDAIDAHGVDAAHLAVMENLGVDTATADRLVQAAQTPTTNAEFKAASQEIIAANNPDTEFSPWADTFYRGGGEGSMPKEGTAQDVVNYEKNDLGNDIKVTPGVDLSKVQAKNLTWLTENEADAKVYGKTQAVTVGDYRIVARDSQGGVLVERQAAPKALEGVAITPDIKGTISELETHIKDTYKGAGVDKAEQALTGIKAELEISEAGYRYRVENPTGGFETRVSGSTFPSWVPEHLRSKELFEKVFENLDLNNLSIPAGRSTKQRELVNILLNEVDAQLGVDTSAIRDKIGTLHEAQNNNKREVAKSDNRRARGSEEGKREGKKEVKKSFPKKQTAEQAYDALQKKIDKEIDKGVAGGLSDLQAMDTPAVNKLYAARNEFARADLEALKNSISKSLSDVSEIVTNSILKNDLGFIEHANLGDIWDHVQDKIKNFLDPDREAEVKTSIVKRLLEERGLDEGVFGDMSGLTEQGQNALRDEIGNEANDIYEEIKEVVLGQKSVPVETSAPRQVDVFGNEIEPEEKPARQGGLNLKPGEGAFQKGTAASPEELKAQQIAEMQAKARGEQTMFGKKPISTQGGFINPGEMIDAVTKGADAKIKDFIEKTMKPIEVTGNLSTSFEKLEGAAQADLETVNKLVESLDISKKDDEALYHHAENPNAPLTEKQKELEKKFDLPFKKLNAELFKRIKDIGTELPNEDSYIARFPKEKPSVMSRIFSPAEGRPATSGQGGVLSKSAPSLKKRTMKILTDAAGNRTVVSIKNGRVTAFENKIPSDLGTLTTKRSQKVTEFFDQAVLPKLEDLAKSLGITHERVTGKIPGKRTAAGLSITGENKVYTRVATPERVLLHEIGHQLDERYGLQEFFKKDDDRNYGKDNSQKELRALADLTLGEHPELVSPSFKAYARKGAEKIAVMFEAYLHVPDQFEEVAPNIFEKFEEFLNKHPELHPIRDLKPSLALQAQTLGGDLLGGKSGSTFVSKEGKKYTIGEATTQEIEQHTNLEYHHSALASRLMQYVKLRQIDRANQFLESWKTSADFADVAVKSDQNPPAGWKMTSQQNFRNYFFEPHIAEALDDMQKKMEAGQYNDAFQGINRALANAIFFNGLAHPLNVATTWLYNRGASSLVIPSAYKSGFKAFARALTAMNTKNDDYMELLRNGAHLMSSDVTNKKLAENLLNKLSDELDAKPDLHDKISEALGYAKDQFSFKKNVLYKLSHSAAWLSNDLLTMQSIFEAMDRKGLSMPEAIKEVSRFIPDYRQQTRLMDKPLSAVMGADRGGATARTLAKLIYNRNISMFGAYHVGLMQSLANTIKDTAKGTDWTFSEESNAKRAQGADKLAMLAVLGMIVFPFLDKLAQSVTGSDNTYVTRFGILKYPYLAYKYATGKTSTTQAFQSIVTPAVGTQTGVELFFNRDLFTGSNIYGSGGEGLGGYLASKVAPIAEANKVATGKVTPGDFGSTLLGIHTPKNTQLALDLNNLLYNEKPNVMQEMKAHVSAGDNDGAMKLGSAFNKQLKDQIKKADIAAGNSGSDARVQFFLNKYGVKMPGALAMTNYDAKYGKGIVDKVLPSGKPVVATSTELPATGVIGVITTYAKAIGTDPMTAFKAIFSGQNIKQVKNGAIIVQRMAFADSQAKRFQDAAAQGLPTPKGMNLDHVIPLEVGGDNSDENLQLIPKAQWEANTPIENFLSKELESGNLTVAQTRELAIRFKAGMGETLSPSLMQEYKDKYGSSPLTAEQVREYKKNLLDK